MQAALQTFSLVDLPARNSSELEVFLDENLVQLQDVSSGTLAQIRLVESLFSVYESTRATARKRQVAQQFVPKIVAAPDFFPKIFKAIPSTTDEIAFALLKLCFEGLFSVLPSSSRLVGDFLEVVATKTSQLSPQNAALVALVAVQFIHIVPDSESYLFDPTCVAKVSGCISSIPPCVALSWGLMLYKLANQPLDPPFHALGVKSVEELQLKSRDILATALDNHAISQLVEITLQLPQDIQYAHTIADLLQPLTTLTQMSQSLANAIAIILEPFPLIARAFWNEQTLVTLELTKTKLPAALPTFLSLARSHPDPMQLLVALNSYMDFVDPHALKQENEDSVLLADDTVVFPARPTDNQGGVVLSKGTVGTVINESVLGSLVMWNIEYNGWSLIGRVIENAICKRTWDENAISSMFLINKTLASLETEPDVERFMSMLSAALAQNDFIDLLQDQFESLLSFDYEHLDIVMLILQFYLQVAKLWPVPIWRVLQYSRLVERDGEGGYMTGIVGAVEVFTNDYSFTLKLLELVQELARSYDSNNISQQGVMTKLMRHVIDVFESFPYWSYHDISQRNKIMHSILNTFNSYHNGSDALSVFLTEDKSRLVQPFIGVLDSEDDEVIEQALKFVAVLIDCRSNSHKSYSLLERELYANSPKLVTLYTERPALKAVVAGVFESLVGAKGQEQPSLLAYLGTEKSRLLLNSLISSVTDDLDTDEVLISVCRFFSTVMSSKQEGLSVLLMSGKDLREPKSSDSLFEKLQDKIVSSHDILSYEVLAALFNAISAPLEVKEYNPALIPILVHYLKEGLDTPFDDSVSTCYFIYSVGQAISLLSRAYFNKKDIGSVFDLLADRKTFENYLRKFFHIRGYKFALHGGVHSLFQNNSFKNARAKDPFASSDFPHYSDKFVYDVDNGEVKEANLNLCFIHSQTILVKAWSQLCTTLAIQTSRKLDVDLIALEALRSITGEELITPCFTDVIEERIGACFFILHTMCENNTLKKSEEVITLALGMLSNDVIGMAVCAGSNTRPKVYKLLLRTLGIQLEAYDKQGTNSLSAPILIEIIKEIVICQIPQVVSEAMTSPQGAAEDLKCLIKILRHSFNILRPSADTQASLSMLMLDTNFAQSIAKLYSGKLEADPQKPTVAKLTLFYVLEWLNSKEMGWYFLNNGIFQILMESPMSEFIQKGDITPSDHPQIHQIWTKGLLKTFLVLLNQLGIRASVITQLFVDLFEAQMRTCFKQWTSTVGKISVDLIEETLLTVALLKSVRRRQDSTVFDSQDELVQAIDHLTSHKKYLATRIGSAVSDSSLDVIIKEMDDLRRVIVV